MGCVVMTLHRSKLIVIGNEYGYGIIDKVHTVHDSVTSVFSPCRPEQYLIVQVKHNLVGSSYLFLLFRIVHDEVVILDFDGFNSI